MGFREYTVKDLEEKINAYFEECESKDIMPDEAGMRLYIGLSKINYDRIRQADTKQEAVTDILLLPMIDKCRIFIENVEDVINLQSLFACAQDRRQSWLSRKAVADGKVSKGCEFQLKQAGNGGLTDKAKDDAPKELVVRINNGGKDPFA